MNILRPNLFWFGSKPNNEKSLIEQLSHWDLNYSFKDDQRFLSDLELAFANSIVFKINDNKVGLLLTRLNSLVIPALNHGLKIWVECSVQMVTVINESLDLNGLKNRVGFLTSGKSTSELLPLLIRESTNRGKSYNDSCLINSKNINLTAEQTIFLKRAFSDCKKIDLESLAPGKSAKVFCVHAIGREGRHPPFLAKFDDLDKIIVEQDHYKNDVTPFISFNLRPNLVEDRCIQGAHLGLLIGDFVENSESLWSIVSRGNGKLVINSLFENTLRLWRIPQSALPNNAKLFETINLTDLTSDRFQLLSKRSIKAAQYGKCLNPEDLVAALNSIPPVDHHTVRIHGDLHAENVRVRNNDAILIDFYSVAWGPSSRDSASLDVWLAFSKWENNINFRTWRKLVDELYDLSEKYIPQPKVRHQPETGSFVWNCIRQIRALALPEQIDKNEYQISLAYWLYKHATRAVSGQNRTELNFDEKRRIYSYYLASKFATKLNS